MLDQMNVLVAQSGGPTTVINASLAGVIKASLENSSIKHIYGSLNGIQGVLDNKLIRLDEIFSGHEEGIERLKHTPAMYLGSCRYKLSADINHSDYATIFDIFNQYNISYFFYIGGNDSMDTVAKLANYAKLKNSDIRIIGIPKTIDNDLMGIDHTPGFGSAAKYIASSILEIAHDTYIYDMDSVTIVEIMGRNAGWLTAASVLARNEYNAAPHLIYLPERPFSVGQFIQDVKQQLTQRKQVIIAVSEGIKDLNGEYISAQSTQVDQFGHVMLNGTGKYLEGLVRNTIGCKVRAIELNVLQRCASHISSLTDIDEAYSLGKKSVEAAINNETGVMVTLKRISNTPYQVEYSTISIDQVANLEKQVPQEWINEASNDINSDMYDYLQPLIVGESNVDYVNGVPSYLPLDHLIEV